MEDIIMDKKPEWLVKAEEETKELMDKYGITQLHAECYVSNGAVFFMCPQCPDYETCRNFK